MLSIERQNQIKQELIEKKNVQVNALAIKFGVSFETIRRDLKDLEKQGVARKTYGGAVLAEQVQGNIDYNYLAHIMVDIKKDIAALAVPIIKPMDCIFIDFSTTCGQLADFLGDIPVNVMTNSLAVMNKLAEKGNISLIGIGGKWEPDNQAFLGHTTVQTIQQYHLDKAFISCRAIDCVRGISDRSEAESDVRRAIINSANQVYLMVDYSKFDKIAFMKTDDFHKITAVITNQKPSEEWVNFLDDKGIGCVYPGVPVEE